MSKTICMLYSQVNQGTDALAGTATFQLTCKPSFLITEVSKYIIRFYHSMNNFEIKFLITAIPGQNTLQYLVRFQN